jgi:tripartite-type tricarboxylate transporter receptor subunit TctC
MIVGFPPGGAADILGRMAAQQLGEALGHQVVVDKAIVTRLNGHLNAALASPELKGRLSTQGADAAGGTPEEFVKLLKADLAKWAKVVKESGARVD